MKLIFYVNPDIGITLLQIFFVNNHVNEHFNPMFNPYALKFLFIITLLLLKIIQF